MVKPIADDVAQDPRVRVAGLYAKARRAHRLGPQARWPDQELPVDLPELVDHSSTRGSPGAPLRGVVTSPVYLTGADGPSSGSSSRRSRDTHTVQLVWCSPHLKRNACSSATQCHQSGLLPRSGRRPHAEQRLVDLSPTLGARCLGRSTARPSSRSASGRAPPHTARATRRGSPRRTGTTVRSSPASCPAGPSRGGPPSAAAARRPVPRPACCGSAPSAPRWRHSRR